MDHNIELSPNPLVQYLDKPAADFTKADIIRYIEDNGIEMVNFRYVGGDGRLKELNFVINSLQQLDNILSGGERVDGSSLFSVIETGSSDRYVIPRFRTAFLNPFSEIPTLDILCSFFNKYGDPWQNAPENILHQAHTALTKQTGYTMEAMGELEYYVLSKHDDLYGTSDQRGYHEAEPFSKFGEFRKEAMLAIAQAGGDVKYGHSEVGNFSLEGYIYEQNEIELNPVNIEDAADQLVIAKWILRTLASRYGFTVTFSPKITVGKAGSGLHIHARLMKDGKNMLIKDGDLSDVALKMVAGWVDLAPSLTAFGNTNPTSYFRLVPHQEAPTNISWGDSNRSVLVRVPLGWRNNINMSKKANPLEKDAPVNFSDKQTIEFRSPDGSADVYLLLAGLAVAARHGFEIENAMDLAKETYVDGDIFQKKNSDIASKLSTLPSSCWESATALQQQKEAYLKHHVFSKEVIDFFINNLKNYNDQSIRELLSFNQEELPKLVNQFFHCG